MTKLISNSIAPAKLNLSLEILGKRPDGYHNIRSLMIPIDLVDEIRIEAVEGGGKIECFCDNPEVPTGAANLAAKAANLFVKKTGLKYDLNISIHKQIPVAGGLAGGSSDAATVLKALNGLFGKPLTEAQLSETGLEIGSDIPFLLGGVPAWVEGRGEILKPTEIDSNLIYLMLNPGFGVSTKWAYDTFDLTIPKIEHKIQYPSFAGVKTVNQLEEPVFSRYPKLRELRDKLRAYGAEASLMSGSGSVVFGVFTDAAKAESVGRKLAIEEQVAVYMARLFSN